MSQANLFDGPHLNQQDEERLTGHLEAIRAYMMNGLWRTKAEIRAGLKLGPEVEIGPRLRDLRKAKFGGLRVEKRRRIGGQWEYRLK